VSSTLKSLVLIALIVLACLGWAQAVPVSSLTGLVTSGDTVTLQAPIGNYLYEWSAEVDGTVIASGSARIFTFTAPLVTQEEGSKSVVISQLLRTVEGGCVAETTATLMVYSLPVCGIDGPISAQAEEVATYSYNGGTTGTLIYEWSVDGVPISGASGSEVIIDWSDYMPEEHTVGLRLTKDYRDVAPGAENPFRTITCQLVVDVTYTSGIEVVKTPSVDEASVGELVTYTYEIRNTGTITLVDVVIDDDKVDNIVLSATTIAPGESITATGGYRVLEADLPGPLVNIVTVTAKEARTGNAVGPATDTAEVTLTYTGDFTVTKEAPIGPARPGDVLTYTYIVDNIGNVPLTITSIEDNVAGTLEIGPTVIPAGESTIFSKSYTVTEEDLPGPLVNVVTVVAEDAQGETYTREDDASVDLTFSSSYSVTKAADVDSANIGDTITYTYTITNTGDTTIGEISVIDNVLGDITPADTVVAAGEVLTFTATHVVTEADLPRPLENTVTVSGTDSQGTPIEETADETVEVTYTSSYSVTKVADVASANIGDTITYTYTITNTGDTTISGISVIDNVLGDITPADTVVAAGEVLTFTATHVVTEADLPSPLENTVTVSGTDSQGTPIEETATETVEVTYTSSYSVTKVADVTSANIGDTITYTYTITNTGDTTISGISVIDNVLGDITPADTVVAAGEVLTFTATHVVTEADLPSPLENTVTVTGTDPEGTPVEETATETVEVTYTSSYSVTKVADVASANIGDTVTYTYTITNTGDTTISGISVIDNVLGDITPADTVVAAGEVLTFTATHVVTEADLPSPLENTVTVSGTDPEGTPVEETATETVEVTYTSSYSVTKVADVASANIGDTVTYTYTITNTGDTTISGISVIDNVLGDITPADTVVAAGEVLTFTATHVVTEADLPSPLENTVTVSGTDPEGNPVEETTTETVEVTYTSSYSVTKVADVASANIGDTITYTYTITNTGDTTISGISVIDNVLGDITPADTVVAAGEVLTFTATHVVTEADLPSPLENTVTVSGTDSQGTPIEETTTETVEVTYTSSYSVTKVADVASANIGDTITYTYTITNTGDTTISGIAVLDSKIGPITPPATEIAPGDVLSFTATYEVTEADLPSPLENTVTVSGTDPEGNPVEETATETVEVTYTSSYSVTKVADVASANIGDTITYTYTITNTGDTTISGIAVLDSKIGPITPSATEIAPGDVLSFTATYEVTEADLPSPLENTVTVSGTDPEGTPIEETATETVEVTYTSSYSVTKVADVASANIGDTITYTYTITNTGDTTIGEISVIDNVLGDITPADTEIAAGEVLTFTATHVVTEADLPSPLENTVIVSGTDPEGTPIEETATETVEVTYTSSYSVTKVADVASANIGDTVTYTYTITNTGDTTISGIAVLDSKIGPITPPATEIAPGDVLSFTATYEVTEADLPSPLENTVTVSGTDSEGTPIEETATETVEVTYTSSYSVTKVADVASANIGDTITYTYTITNTGDTTIGEISVIDNVLGDITPADTEIAAGEVLTFTATHVVTEADLPGPIVNTVTVTGTDPQGTPVEEPATETVDVTYAASIEVSKSASTSSAAIGETVTYTYIITNTGDVAVTDLALTDDQLGTIELPQTSLLAGESITVEKAYQATKIDLPRIVNVATATAKDSITGNDVPPATDTVTVSLSYEPDYTVTKTASPESASVGQTVVYTYVVENTGNIVLEEIILVDDQLGPVTLDKTSLQLGESATGTLEYTIAPDDLPGPLDNIVTAYVTDITFFALDEKSASESVELTYTRGISLTKEALPESAGLGETVTYTYTIENTGDTTISLTSLVDDVLGNIGLSVTTLGPGESTTATATHIAVDADLDGEIEKELTNTATITASDSIGSLEDTDSATVTISRAKVDPIAECVYLHPDGHTYTVFFSYDNANSVPVTIPVGDNNRFSNVPSEMDKGQPIVFQPGLNTYVFSVDSVNAGVEWHLDGTKAEANKNHPGECSGTCEMDGPGFLCTNREDPFRADVVEEAGFTYEYAWYWDGAQVGTTKIISLSGEGYEPESMHTLMLVVTKKKNGVIFSVCTNTMSIKVIAEPEVGIAAVEGGSSGSSPPPARPFF